MQGNVHLDRSGRRLGGTTLPQFDSQRWGGSYSWKSASQTSERRATRKLGASPTSYLQTAQRRVGHGVHTSNVSTEEHRLFLAKSA